MEQQRGFPAKATDLRKTGSPALQLDRPEMSSTSTKATVDPYGGRVHCGVSWARPGWRLRATDATTFSARANQWPGRAASPLYRRFRLRAASRSSD